jgi:hypothetical protein
VFSGLSPLVIEEVTDGGGWIRVRTRTPGGDSGRAHALSGLRHQNEPGARV